MGFFDGLGRALEIAGHIASAINDQSFARQLMSLRRDQVGQVLSKLINSTTVEQWQDIEARFLQFSQTIIDPQKRLRAMEVYAIMKLMEREYHGEILGFLTDGGALG